MPKSIADPARPVAASIIQRNFRGAVMYLEESQRGSKLFCWIADRAKAQRFDSARAALTIAERAAIDYGADCAVIDATGTALQPAAARVGSEPTGRAKPREFPYSAQARETFHGAHCDNHVAYTDGCADCHAAHCMRCVA